jgi:hypothetical protein
MNTTFSVRVPRTATYDVSGTCRCRKEAFTLALYSFDGRTKLRLGRTNYPLLRGPALKLRPHHVRVQKGRYVLHVTGDAYWHAVVSGP